MKILHNIQRYPPAIGGSEFWCQGISRYLSEQGHKVTVLTLDVYLEDEFWIEPPQDNCRLRFGKLEYDNKVKVIRCKRTKVHPLLFKLFQKLEKTFKIYLYGPHSIQMYIRMFSQIKNNDIIHLHTIPYPHNLLGFFVAKLFSKKIVITPHFHIGHPQYETPSNYWLIKNCDAVFTVSDYEKQYFEDKGLDRNRIFVTYNSIDPFEYKTRDLDGFRRDIFNKYGIKTNTKIIIFVGRKIEYKGLDVLIEAVRDLRKKISLKLFLIGPNFPWFNEYYRKLSAQEKRDIIDLGVVPHQTKVNLLCLSEFLVLPSKFEAFGIVFLEAWICGLPVIGASGPVTSAIIDKGGLLFRYGDTGDLKSKMASLLAGEKKKELAYFGLKQVLDKYVITKIGEEIVNIYDCLLKGIKRQHFKWAKDIVYKKGWYDLEWDPDGFDFRWSKDKAEINLNSNGEKFLLLRICSKYPDATQRLSITDAKGNSLSSLPLDYGWRNYVLSPGEWKAPLYLKVNKTLSPTMRLGDDRELGIMLSEIRLLDRHKGEYIHQIQKNTSLNWQEIREGKTVLESTAQMIGVDFFGKCNINPPCLFCWRTGWDDISLARYNDYISEIEDFKNMGRHFFNAAKIIVCTNGEPLLHPRILEFFDFFSDTGKIIECSTNAHLLKDKIRESVLGKDITFFCSLDAATKKTYAKLRGEGFETVIKNIEEICRAKKYYNNKPYVNLIFMPMRENIKELELFFDLACRLQVDKIILRPLREIKVVEKEINRKWDIKRKNFNYSYSQQVLSFSELMETQKKCDQLSRKYGIKFWSQLEAENSGSKNYLSTKSGKSRADLPKDKVLKCIEPWHSLYALGHGFASHCCFDYDYTVKDWKKIGLDEYWNSSAIIRRREELSQGRLGAMCLKSESCPIVKKYKLCIA